MLHKQQEKLSGHLACNEKCTGDIDVKGGFISVATEETDRAENLKMLHCVIELNPSEVRVYSCISALYTSNPKPG